MILIERIFLLELCCCWDEVPVRQGSSLRIARSTTCEDKRAGVVGLLFCDTSPQLGVRNAISRSEELIHREYWNTRGGGGLLDFVPDDDTFQSCGLNGVIFFELRFVFDDGDSSSGTCDDMLAELLGVCWINTGRDSTRKDRAEMGGEPMRRIGALDCDNILGPDSSGNQSLGESCRRLAVFIPGPRTDWGMSFGGAGCRGRFFGLSKGKGCPGPMLLDGSEEYLRNGLSIGAGLDKSCCGGSWMQNWSRSWSRRGA